MLSRPRASKDSGSVFAALQPNYTNPESVTGRYIVIGDSVVVPVIIGYAVGDCGVLDTIANPYNSSAISGAPEDVVQYANGDVQLEFFSNASSSSNILTRSRRSSFHAARTSVSPPLNPSFWTCLNTTITTTLALITANATDSDSPHHHNRNSLSQGGAIAIVVVSVVVPFLVVLTVFVWCCCCGRKAKRKQMEDRERVVREGEAYCVQMEMLAEPELD